MNLLNFLRNPHFQLIAGMIIGITAIILVHDFIANNLELSIKWGLVIGVALFICLLVSAYTYLIVGKYDKAQWDRKFSWSIGIIQLLSAALLVTLIIATYLALMASGYQLGGILVPWMEILIIMFAIIPLPAIPYWAMVNLRQTFQKKYAWISLYAHLIPLALVLALAYSGDWLREFYLWLRAYLQI